LRQGNVSHSFAHPVRQARIELAGRDIGYVAEVHPLTLQRLERPSAAALFEIDFDLACRCEAVDTVAVPPPSFPAARRDFAVVVADGVPAETVRAAIAEAAPEVEHVAFQSLYRGGAVPAGEKSLAWSVTLRHPERTLDDAEVQRISDAIVGAVAARAGGRLR
jgi:phenylalanyl-tRNA synthetase beta chain